MSTLKSVPFDIALVIGSLARQDVVAQRGPVLRAGDRVRIESVTDREGRVGQLLFLDTYNVTFRPRGDSAVTIPIANIQYFEVSRGVHSGVRFGVPLLGTALGALVGPSLLGGSSRCQAVGAIAPECRRETSDVLIGAAWGTIAFTGLSRFVGRERWAVVNLDPALGVVERRPAIGVRFSVRF